MYFIVKKREEWMYRTGDNGNEIRKVKVWTINEILDKERRKIKKKINPFS